MSISINKYYLVMYLLSTYLRAQLENILADKCPGGTSVVLKLQSYHKISLQFNFNKLKI